MKALLTQIELTRATEIARVRVVEIANDLLDQGINLKDKEIDVIYDHIYSAVIDYITSSKEHNQN